MKVESNSETQAVELIAETPEEVKLLTEMWYRGLARQTLSREPGGTDNYTSLIFTPKALPGEEPGTPVEPTSSPKVEDIPGEFTIKEFADALDARNRSGSDFPPILKMVYCILYHIDRRLRALEG